MSATLQDKISVSLPPPVVQSKRSYSWETKYDLENDATVMARLKKYLLVEVDEERSTVPMAAYCFITGVINALIFSAIFIWCGSQTGNSVQLALALARLLSWEHDYTFHLLDQQALCSLISFAFAVFLGGRIGDKIGCKTRAWLFLGTFVQALFTVASAILMWEGRESSVADARDDPAWTDTLSFLFTGFLSASMGLQGIMAKRVNTHFATTVALTTTWCELMADPKLLDIRRLIASRDHKILTIACFILGGFVGRASLDKIGSASTLGVTAGIRLMISVWWLFTPAKNLGM
ncbi:hypothetical protein DEU56DRAFT_533761 [Suillus clintonianus]|uniref:uncharacterized protein n=1 Tax=Suillus clintonianus TaxID=1904413 RepID=UPI001B85F4CE|nr:uncharacterized protein DEU56DRAFT_533761 [Suillus clintonianus]KAG2127130.1 hypothetical protein DEU56DRAFT_533761 [Suillus clintonianus]